MSLGRLLRRASSKASDLLTLNPGGSSTSSSILDGEIIYSKNNVCVHPPELLQGLGEHHPGEGLQALLTHPFYPLLFLGSLFLSASTHQWRTRQGRLWGTEESHPQAGLSALLLIGKIDNASSSGSIDLPDSIHPFVLPEDEQLSFEGSNFCCSFKCVWFSEAKYHPVTVIARVASPTLGRGKIKPDCGCMCWHKWR